MITNTARVARTALVALLLALLAAAAPAEAGGTLRIAMTASDVPTTTGAPDNGFEGLRFFGYPVYEGLVLWDLTRADRLAEIRPGLAESWEQDKTDMSKWIFHLRHGVKFHDGSDFNADAVIWNFDRYFKPDVPQTDPTGGAFARARDPWITSFRKIDDYTVEIGNPRPMSYFPGALAYLFFSSPAQFQKTGSWAEFGKSPSGTGPFKITEFQPRVSATLTRNDGYWDQSRVPKLDKMVLIPMPEATTRLAALRSGQVDWIEVPPPDAVPSLKAAGFEIVTNSYPHVWPWVLNFGKPDGPWADVRVRRAINYCTNREGLVTLLNGLAEPAVGIYHKSDPYFGQPKQQYSYDPDKAKALLKEAGYGPDKPVKAKVMISTSGSGQMLPLPMNEYLQQNLKDCNFDISFEVVDWGTMLVAMRNPPTGPQSRGVDAVNISLAHGTEFSRFTSFFLSSTFPPNGFNWANWSNPEFDALVDKIEKSSDPEEIAANIRKAHEVIVDDAAWLFIVHDLNPRAMTKHIKGFVSAQSWFQDFTRIYME
ncbi:MAG TPA: ABC transporter substrate-binding protein [Stellaceae bacterium]|nr:ABC transporter substrate-binding protein [Stellaceae bacterium]